MKPFIPAKNLIFSVLVLTVVMAGLTACATSGVFTSANITNVALSENNYRIVASNVKGEASAAYVLGFSASFHGEMQTLALIRIKGEGMLYQEALENLWRNFEEQSNRQVEGGRLALINVRYDSESLNVVGLYTKPKVSIRADIIEFVD